MKYFAKLAVLGAAFVAVAPFASATALATGTLNIGSNSTSDISEPSSGLFNFVNPGGLSLPDGTGTLSLFTAAGGASAVNFATFNMASLPVTPVLTVTEGANSLTFTATSGSMTTAGGGTVIDLFGVLSEDSGAYVNNAATLVITSQTLVSGGTAASYSATLTAPTPEPSSLVLLGSGLVSAAGMLVRRRKLSV